jgi:hypothetical protein
VNCNRCQRAMRFDATALVPALRCPGCGRLVPITGVKHRFKGSQRAHLNRALRAGRRRAMAQRRL